MAIHGKFWNGYLLLGGANDFSDHVKEITLSFGHEVLDLTCMSNATKINAAGIKNWQVDVTFEDDLADDDLDEVLHGYVGAAAFALAFRVDSGAISTSNPEYQGNVVLGSPYTIGGAHGAPLRKTITFVSAGDLTRDVTP